MKKIFKLLLLSLFISVVSKAQIKLVGNITTNGVASYPTHIDSLGKGGYMTIPTLSERNSIPTLRRKYGMLVYVQANDSLYKLSSVNLDNTNWITMGLASVLKLANDSILVYTKIKADSITLAGRITSLGTSVAGDIANAISGSSGDLAAEIARATAAENALSVNINDETARAKNKSTFDSTAVYAKIVADSNELRNLINVSKNKSTLDSTAVYTKIIADSNVLRSLINTANTNISTNLAKEKADSLTLATKINTTENGLNTSILAEKTRATNAETTLSTNIASETTRAKNKSTLDSTAVYARIVADSNVLRSLINTANTNIANNLAKEVTDSLTLASRIASSENNITNNTTDIAANLNKQKIDSSLLRNLININTSTINTNLLKEQNDSLTIVTKLRSDSTDLNAKIVSDSTVLRGLINTNTNDINTNRTNIANNAINISTNASNIAANTSAISNRVSFTDMPAFLLPYLMIDDTLNMLSVYRSAMIDNNAKIGALIADTATLITRFGYKENISNKSTDVNADGTSNTKYPTVKSVKDFVDAAITAATPDATTTSKGKIQLAGDLRGIAASPIVNTVGGSSSSTIHTAELLANASTDANTASTIVKRDASGNFNAGNITAELTGNVTGDLTGNASTATKLAATKNIYGNAFDGSSNLTQAIAGTFGGTGVNNGSKTITLGGNILTANDFTTVGNFSTTLTSIGATNITLPTTGTIATLAGTETLTNKTMVDVALTGVPTAPTAAAGTNNTQLATTSFVVSTTTAATPDASTTVKGKVQLAGDLGGIATSPTVNTVGGSSSTTIHTAELLANAATEVNTQSTIVKRDASGNFNAGNITAALTGNVTGNLTGNVTGDVVGNVTGNLTGNASTATKLAATKNIYGNAFDGSANLTQAVAGTFGGTGVNNGSKTITLGGNILTASDFTTVGNYSTTLTSIGATNIILPTTGTLATLAGAETLSNKTIASVNLTGVPTAPTAADGTNTTQVATTAFVLSTTAAATPDATSIIKGKVQLTNDFGGSAALPEVVKVGGSTATAINAATILSNAATNANTASAIVKRDINGDFSAGTITANVVGTSTNITGIALGANGGTGVDNTGKTITLGGNINTGRNFTTTGVSNSGSDIILKTTNTTNITLPTSGTLATLAGTEALTNKTINGLSLTPAATGFSIAGGTTAKSLTLSNDATISGTNTGDQTINLTGDITGTGTGTFSTTLANSGVTAGVYGGATSVPTITIDEKGRITNAAVTTITGVSSIGSLLESGKIIVGDQYDQAAKVDMSGDISITNAGATNIGANKITTAKMVNAAVTYAKMQNISATDKILGRISPGAGNVEEISTIGTGNVVRAISPAFTGTPTVPTATYPSNDGTIASTQYVTTAINNISASSVSGILGGTNGGTGVDNTGRTITLGGNVNIAKNFTTIGTTGSNASDITFKTTGPTVLELPLSGKLATMSDVSSSSIGGQQITGIINPVNGGTGVANDNTKTITLGGTINTGANFTTTGVSGSGADITFKTTGATDVILPTTGTIATLAGTATLTAKTINALDNTILNISNASIASGANIEDTKLATISSAGKVLNAATSATNANVADAIVARDANGAFTAGIITASLNGNASTATKLAATKTIYGNAFDGSANLSNIIASGFGGTGNGFTKFIGPATGEKIFTLPNANATILTTNALVTVDQGGTGAATATQNFVFAGPATGSSAGAPSFRALTAADLPAGSGSYIANSLTQQANSNFNISGNGIVGGDVTANSFVVANALGTQFLKGDGSLDATTYAIAGANSNITSLTGLTTALSIAQGGTGSISKNFVDLSTAQTIAGAKTFSGLSTFNADIKVNGLNIGAGPNATISTNTVFGKNALANAATTDLNTAIGYNVLTSNGSTGFSNTGVGAFAITSNTTGQRNTAIGESSMLNNTTGSSNTAVGEYASSNNVIGSDNTSIGTFALQTNLGSKNTAIGARANTTSTTLENATAIGYDASVSASNTIQLGNTNITNVKTSGSITAGAVTYPKVDGVAGQVLVTDGSGVATFRTIDGAGANLTNGKILVGNASNVATAVNISGDISITNTGAATIADASITTSKIAAGAVETANLANSTVTYAKIQNVSAKSLIGNKLTTAGTAGEITLGTGLALDATTGILSSSGSGGTVTSVGALTIGTTGSDVSSTVANTSTTPVITLNIPDASATARGLITTGIQTIAGAKTFSGISTFNTDININGLKIGKGNSNSGENTALGVNALSTNTGNFNTAVGYESLKLNGANGYNSAFGSRSLLNNTTGNENTGVGFQSMYSNTTGSFNTSVGVNALSLNTTGSFNVALGGTSLYNNTTGAGNTALGRTALFSNTTGTNNTGIGIGADVQTGNLTNATAIGAGAVVSASNTVQVGNLSVTTVKTSGNIIAGTVTYPNAHNSIPNQVLTIDAAGNASFNTMGAAGATLTNGKILVGNASNVATAVDVSGDITMTNTGVVTINTGSVSTADLASSAVTYAKLQNVSAKSLIGNKLATAGTAGEITLGTGLALDATTGILSASGSGGTVTNVNALTIGTTGTDVNSTIANGTTSATITLNIPDASATARGLVTAGAQTFAGAKTFSSDIVMGSARFGLGGGTGGAGGRNIAMGISALQANTTGQWNVALGAYALQSGTTASNNVAVGNEVMGVSAPGNSNTGVGNRSLLYNTGSSNTAIGASSGATVTSGSNNTFLGTSADADAVGRTNATAIGNGAIVTADNSFQLGNSAVTNVKTAGTLTAGNVTYPNAHNSIANQILTINASGAATWAPNSSASLSGGVAGALPYQSGVGVTAYTTAGTAGQILTSAGTGAPTWTTTIPVANGGTGANTLTSNAVLLGNGTSAVQTVAPGTSGNVLVSNGTTWVSQAAPASGVSTVGSISATSNVKGATISGTSITLTAADGTNGGVVTTAAQTFAGTKTFADVNLSGALNGASSSSSTIAGFNAAITPITTAITISSANAATYNGKVLVCSGSAFTVTFDSSVPVGFSCMILQSDNNTVSFAGTNNRYNYSSTSGIYAIATAMCYASGAVLLTGDLQ